MTPPDAYRARAAECERMRDAAARRSLAISRLRLLTFFAAVALCWIGVDRGGTVLAALGLGGFVAFGALVVRHALVEDDVAAWTARRAHNRRGLARLARAWDDLPEVDLPAGVDLRTHGYARDLDLVGRASMMRWLGRSATPAGAASLWTWLLAPAGVAEIIGRQQALDDLAPRTAFRESLAAEGDLWRGRQADDVERFLEWATSREPVLPGGAALRIPVRLLTVAIWILIALQIAGLVGASGWMALVTIGVALWFALGRRIGTAFTRVSLGQRALTGYGAMLALASQERWTSGLLGDLQQRIRSRDGDAAAALASLARIVGFGELRTGAALLHVPIQAFTLWDFHVLLAAERWRSRWGGAVRGWLDALGTIDALAVCAAVRHDHPDWARPTVDPSVDRLSAQALGHPLIPDDRRVPNDVAVGPAGAVLFVTGSNMSGKSTLLRAIGLNVVLAQAGLPVCARALHMPPADLQTSIRIEDSLELGLSYFMAALARLKAIVDAAEIDRAAGGRVLFFLLDEILQGTNSAERAVAVRAVARHLLDAGAIGVMTSHDLTLASEEPLASAAQLVHFTEQLTPQGAMTFDYRLRDGLAPSRNALRLMKLIGIEPELLS